MEYNVDDIAHMTDEELRNALTKKGECVGPITSGTRYIWQSKLRKLLLPSSSEVQDESTALSNEINKPTPVLQNKLLPESDTYYGVFIPAHFQIDDYGIKKVYTDRIECLALLKRFQNSRFKAFPTYDEALCFSEYGPITVAVPSTPDRTSANPESTAPVNLEKPSAYRGPKYQDVLKFRKVIESGDLDHVNEMVQSNPRFLVSSGDTPSILREGPRYNGLHLASRSNKVEICRRILSIVSDYSFFQRLYPDDSRDWSERRSAYLLDLYLNTPDKGFNETPLHFSCKEGFVGCVSVLLSYSECDRAPVNRYGQTPRDMICSRATSPDDAVKAEINALFDNRYFVPVLRDEANCLPPRVGSPFSPSISNDSSPSNPCSMSPFSSSPLSPSFKIKGYAGPMSPHKAEMFYNRWKRTSSVSSPAKTTTPQGKMAALRVADLEKGVERVGRNLALEFDVEWKENWEFLGNFVNITSVDGLRMLEQHLKTRYKEVMNRRNQEDLTKACEALERPSSCNRDQSSTPKENFEKTLDGDVTRSSMSSLGELCQNLEALRLNASLSPNPEDKADLMSRDHRVQRSPKSSRGNFSSSLLSHTLNNNHESPLSQSMDKLNTSTQQYNFAVQSARISSQRLCSILSDVSDCVSLHVGPDFAVARKLRNKVKSEIAALRKVLSQCLSLKRLGDEVDFSFVHVFLAAKTTEHLVQNVSVSSLYLAFETMKLLVENIEAFADSSSDEEDEVLDQMDSDEREVFQHFQCIVRGVLKSLEIVMRLSKEGKEDQAINLNELGKCTCIWTSSSDVPDSLKSPTASGNQQNSSKLHNISTGDKFSKAHNFLHRVLYGTPHNNTPGNPGQKKSQDVSDSSLVKHLTFEDEESLALDNVVSSEEDNESFASALSSLEDDVQMLTPDKIVEVFVNGSEPCRFDLDALNALEDLSIDEKCFPHVSRWLRLVQSMTQEERKRWHRICPKPVSGQISSCDWGLSPVSKERLS